MINTLPNQFLCVNPSNSQNFMFLRPENVLYVFDGAAILYMALPASLPACLSTCLSVLPISYMKTTFTVPFIRKNSAQLSLSLAYPWNNLFYPLNKVLLYMSKNVYNSHWTQCIFLWIETFLWNLKLHMLTSIRSRISRFSNKLLETRQDQGFQLKILKRGKKQYIPN